MIKVSVIGQGKAKVRNFENKIDLILFLSRELGKDSFKKIIITEAA